MNTPDSALADELQGFLVMHSAPVLCANLDHTLETLCGVHHPAPFAHKQGHGLLDVDVLAGGRGQERDRGVPVVRRRDHNRLNILVVEQPAEIGVAFRARAAVGQALLEPGLINVGESHQVNIRLALEIVDVLPADEPVADEPHPDAIVCAENALRSQRRRR